MRYWSFGLLGVAISAAAVAVVTWCTYALTRVSLCTPGDASLGCVRDPGQLGLAIAVAILVAIPVGSKLFARRTRPRGGPLGPLALGLALTAAGGGALASALGSASGTGAAQAVGFGVGAPLLSLGPFLLIAGFAAVGRRGDEAAARIAQLKANGYTSGQIAQTLSAGAPTGAAGAPTGAAGTTTPPAQSAGIGSLAAQLAQIAAARERAAGDALAGRLRRIDDLRASGLLSPEEHAAKRAELLREL